MPRFRTTLVAGKKNPYRSWTFIIVPADLADRWGPGPKAVEGSISGHPFRGTASRGEGELRIPVPRGFLEETGLARGDRVDAALELDAAPRVVAIPDELRRILEADADLAARFADLPPAHRRAWAAYVAEAKRPDTRLRRAARAPAGIRARAFPGGG
ncbi:MAG: YdeI/OmpD-associated family protein [Gemmatimonadales bacterium]